MVLSKLIEMNEEKKIMSRLYARKYEGIAEYTGLPYKFKLCEFDAERSPHQIKAKIIIGPSGYEKELLIYENTEGSTVDRRVVRNESILKSKLLDDLSSFFSTERKFLEQNSNIPFDIIWDGLDEYLLSIGHEIEWTTK